MNTEISADSTPNNNKAKKKKRTSKYYAFSFFIKLAVTALVIWAVHTFAADVHICHTNSAFPAVRDGDLCITYRLADIKKGNMIVYKQGDNIRFGRIIASGGDKVEIFNDYITVNDYGISDNSVYPTSPEGSAVSYPYHVPDNCVFVLNDHRSDISDSRTYGGIPLDDIEGTVVFIMRMREI